MKKVGPSGTTYYIGDHYEVINGDPTKYIFAGSLRIAKVAASGTYYFHKDHLGSSSAMTSVLGTVQENTNYRPYGEQREHTGLTLSNYKFTDQELDPEIGLYNYGARLYDAVTGRFISADTIVPDYANPQSLNRYSYANNNPLIYVDPTGHYAFDINTSLSYDSSYFDAGYYGSSNTSSGGYSLGTTQLTWNNYSYYSYSGTSNLSAPGTTTGMTQNTGLPPWYTGGYITSYILKEVTMLTRIIFAEDAADYEVRDAMEALGSAIRNRIEIGRKYDFPYRTYTGTITQKNQFEPVATNSDLWQKSVSPSNLTGSNRFAYERALTVAEGVYFGAISDPTKGAVFFHSGSTVPKDFQRMINQGIIDENRQKFGGHYFYRYK